MFHSDVLIFILNQATDFRAHEILITDYKITHPTHILFVLSIFSSPHQQDILKQAFLFHN